jgi:hypothetical protein
VVFIHSHFTSDPSGHFTEKSPEVTVGFSCFSIEMDVRWCAVLGDTSSDVVDHEVPVDELEVSLIAPQLFRVWKTFKSWLFLDVSRVAFNVGLDEILQVTLLEFWIVQRFNKSFHGIKEVFVDIGRDSDSQIFDGFLRLFMRFVHALAFHHNIEKVREFLTQDLFECCKIDTLLASACHWNFGESRLLT